ncbi:NAD(P)-dependent oxidoreductase [Agromyces sp. NBRC 114283]|uniref:NAD(P)-dependent oxidoreductase n=1 Tax=Agromyces sp. NBRC 114283 TaxID=2994521 RepID=UPI0024A0E332|nr:NAD(P)-dependent oxidoreductase [Agromyces sp. NBRC 114283]GLU88558.1 glycerate dehydrogenase [Agromyces sp. NBRC 114283]
MTDNGVAPAATRATSADAHRILLSVPEAEARAMFPEELLAELRELGELRFLAPAELADAATFRTAMADTDIAITAWGFPRLDAARLAAAPRLGFVMHAASSLRAITSDAFWAAGIPVSQAGAAMAPAVAELALTFTLTLLRRTERTDHALRGGASWADARQVPRAREIRGARIGVVGASRTGRAYLELCLALGAEVLVHDPYLPAGDPLLTHAVGLDELLDAAEVLALHAPATAETAGMIGAAELARLRDGALVVNTARAELLDADALYAEVTSGRLDAALDVFETEPLPERWRSLPNVMITPHLGGATVESRRRAGRIVVDEVRRFLDARPLEHRITRRQMERMG